MFLCFDQMSQILFLRFYLFLSRERGREGEREGEKHQCVFASGMPSTGELVCNPGMCPDWESNMRPFASQACTQSTELHQPGQMPQIPHKFMYVMNLLKGRCNCFIHLCEFRHLFFPEHQEGPGSQGTFLGKCSITSTCSLRPSVPGSYPFQKKRKLQTAVFIYNFVKQSMDPVQRRTNQVHI